jgi:hypothetical protein
VIRSATSSELSNYEKHKLAGIEDSAQKNVIESVAINGQTIAPLNKEIRIDLGNLAFKQKVTSAEIDPDELFFIKCEIDEKTLT